MVQQTMLGLMGVSYVDYCTMPVRTAFIAMSGHHLGEKHKMQMEWAQARFIASAMTDTSSIKFDWEKEVAAKSAVLPHEEYLKRFERVYGKNKHTG